MLRLFAFAFGLVATTSAAQATTVEDYLQAVRTAEVCNETRLTLIEELRLSDLIKQNADENFTLLNTASQLEQLRREAGLACSTDAAGESLTFYQTEVAPFLGRPVYRSPIPLS